MENLCRDSLSSYTAQVRPKTLFISLNAFCCGDDYSRAPGETRETSFSRYTQPTLCWTFAAVHY